MGPDKYYVKDLKKAYRILRKEKNQYPKGDEKRIELHRQMKELKEKIKKFTFVELSPEKQTIIDKILSYYRREHRAPMIELEKFSVEDLEFHYYKITGKVKTREDYKKIKEATAK
jgi:hypothetical protein